MTENIVVDENEQVALRLEKLAALRQGNAFPNDFKPNAFANEVNIEFTALDKDSLAVKNIKVSLAGRILTRRLMGKASFVHLQDMTGKIQLYFKEENLIINDGEKIKFASYAEFLDYDIGDIIGVSGILFKTNTGELSVKVTECRLLTKALRPLPDKFHGLADKETCYRQRYLDLMINEKTRNTFKIRMQVIQGIRNFLLDHKFMEVETPMMHVIPGGASATPFTTHHNALDMPLYLRIAPELYLKRLVVGGIDRVFEINRNFRNEGLSTRHNPEFTMVEFYQAYATYEDLMDFTEQLFRKLAQDILGTTMVPYQGENFDFSKPFTRMSMMDAVLYYNSSLKKEQVTDRVTLVKFAQEQKIEILPTDSVAKIQLKLFEETVEHKLKDPTFITQYPKEVSPLARVNNDNPEITDRFELFIGGREIANAFSELNDAEDQAARFKQQAENLAAGDNEAMHYDADYITALEYGLPPTAGEGIGIDRLVMLFTDSPTIKDVILFPHMRPKI